MTYSVGVTCSCGAKADFVNDHTNFGLDRWMREHGQCGTKLSRSEYQVVPWPVYSRLLEAVRNVYYAGYWSCDRFCGADVEKLWTELRDAAGFMPGNSPKRMR